MIINLVEYVKNNFFDNIEFDGKLAVISDIDLNIGKGKFFKINALEPVGQIVAVKEKYDVVFVVLNRLNYDNIYRLYKYDLSGICVLNLNSGYSGLGIKTISPDMDDIYIKNHIEVLEPMDKNNLNFFIEEFLSNKRFTHIRIVNKEVEEKIGDETTVLDYKEIINFNQFGITGFNGTLLVYGSLLQEALNVVGLLQSEGLTMDMFWIGNYKKVFSFELVQSLENQDKIFILGDFDSNYFKDFIYSKFFELGIGKEDIYFITPENLNKQVIKEFLAESVNMDPIKIYNRIRENLEF